MSKRRNALGAVGEEVACRELERRGYRIVARRYRRRQGEIDVIARDGATLAFVEVKCRGSMTFGTPVEAVTSLKRRRMTLVAADYVMRHRLGDSPCRFDVVSVRFEGSRPVVTLIQGAFTALE